MNPGEKPIPIQFVNVTITVQYEDKYLQNFQAALWHRAADGSYSSVSELTPSNPLAKPPSVCFCANVELLPGVQWAVYLKVSSGGWAIEKIQDLGTLEHDRDVAFVLVHK